MAQACSASLLVLSSEYRLALASLYRSAPVSGYPSGLACPSLCLSVSVWVYPSGRENSAHLPLPLWRIAPGEESDVSHQSDGFEKVPEESRIVFGNWLRLTAERLTCL